MAAYTVAVSLIALSINAQKKIWSTYSSVTSPETYFTARMHLYDYICSHRPFPDRQQSTLRLLETNLIISPPPLSLSR